MIALEVLESRYWVRSIFCQSAEEQTEPRNGDVAPVAVRWPCPFRLTVRGGSDFVPLWDDCLPLAMHGGDRQQPV